MLTFQAAVTRRAALGRRTTTAATAAAAQLRAPRSFPNVAAPTIRRRSDMRLSHHSTRVGDPYPLSATSSTTNYCLVGKGDDAPPSSSPSPLWQMRGHAVTGSSAAATTLPDCYRAGNHFSTVAVAAEEGDPNEDIDGPKQFIDRRTADGDDSSLPQNLRRHSSDQLFYVLERQKAARLSAILLVVERLAAEEHELLRRFEREADRRTDWAALLRGDDDESEDEDTGEVDAFDDEREEEIDGGCDGDGNGLASDATEKAGNNNESSISLGSSPPTPSILSSPSMGHARRIAAAGRMERALRLYNRNHPLNNDVNNTRSQQLRLRRMNEELLETFLECVENAGGGASILSDSQGLELLTAFAQSRDVQSAHTVLDRWIDDIGAERVPVRAYRVLCDAVGESGDDASHPENLSDSAYIATYLFDTLRGLDDEYYRIVCLPRLLLGMCKLQAYETSARPYGRPRPHHHRQLGGWSAEGAEAQARGDGDWGGTQQHDPLSRCIREVYSYMTTATSDPQEGAGKGGGRDKVAPPPLSSESPYFDPYVFDGILAYLALTNAHVGRDRVFFGIGEEQWGNRLSRSVREKRWRWDGGPSTEYPDYMDDTIPCNEILKALVNCGHYPNDDVVMTTLHNEHPFDTNINRTRNLLRSIQRLRKNVMTTAMMEEDASVASSASTIGDLSSNMYRLDLGTIEQICEAGGRRGKPDLVILCWDLAESMGYHRPTELMYESSIHAFLTSKRKEDHYALAVLSEMEGCGYVPSRSLIRTISECTRLSPGRIDNMYYILTNGTEGTTITTASFNCVLSAYGQAGLIDRAFATFDDFSKYGITPNADSFSFLMESLAYNVVGLTKKRSDRVRSSAAGRSSSTGSPLSIDLEQLIESADMIIDMMKDMGCGMNPHVLHQYVRVLTCGGELQRARSILDGAIASGDRVLIDTLILFGRQCAFRGEMGVARDVVPGMILRAGYSSVPHILRATIVTVMEADAEPGIDVEEESSQDADQR